MDWISVKDRLPDRQGPYLVFSPDWINKFGEIFRLPVLDIGCYAISTNNNLNGFYIDAIRYPVTHWMPLPNPPTEAKE